VAEVKRVFVSGPRTARTVAAAGGSQGDFLTSHDVPASNDLSSALDGPRVLFDHPAQAQCSRLRLLGSNATDRVARVLRRSIPAETRWLTRVRSSAEKHILDPQGAAHLPRAEPSTEARTVAIAAEMDPGNRGRQCAHIRRSVRA
jgi:hypothetical protein